MSSTAAQPVPTETASQARPVDPDRRRSAAYPRRPRASPRAGRLPHRESHFAVHGPRRAQVRILRRPASRPELHPRYHIRQRGPRSALADPRSRIAYPGDRDDRLGQRRAGRRSHAPRRLRLHPETLGQRPAAHHSADPDRSEQRGSPRAARSKPKTGCCAPQICRR